MLAIPPLGASSNIALWRAKIKPPVELVVDDLDKLQGHEADVVGRTNEKNGADRIVDGIEIQTKYYKTGNQIGSNMYMDTSGRKPIFRNAKSEMDRKNMEIFTKRWINKKQLSFDGDVYVENGWCYLKLLKDTGKCTINGQETTALIFSKKHLTGLYLQCLMYRKEIMEHQEYGGEASENCERIFRLEDVDVLFQCLLMDQMKWEDGKLCVPFCTVYLLKNK